LPSTFSEAASTFSEAPALYLAERRALAERPALAKPTFDFAA
jgi:hypothetical protein